MVLVNDKIRYNKIIFYGYFDNVGNVCVVSRDPLFYTFDCVTYEYHGKCDYTLVKTCAETDLPFEVIGHLRRLEYHPKVSVLRALEIRVANSVS